MRIARYAFERKLNNIANNKTKDLSINFAFDELETDDIALLVAALYTNISCHTMDLSVNNLNLESCQLLGAYLSVHHTLQKLELAGNCLVDESASVLFDSLATNCSIKILNLKDNELSDAVIPHLKNLLLKNTSLQLINLRFNKFTKDGIQELLSISNVHCLIHVDSKDKKYLEHLKRAKSKIKILFKLQAYIRFVLYENAKYSEEARAAKKLALWQSIDSILQDIIQKNPFICDAVDCMVDLLEYSYTQDQFHDPISFLTLCLSSADLTQLLLFEVLGLPTSESRDSMLEAIGNALFCNQRSDQQYMSDLINAHICFMNIRQSTENVQKLILETYRSLVTELGITENTCIKKWKQNYTIDKKTPIPENIIEQIDEIIAMQQGSLNASPVLVDYHANEILTLLHSHRTKIFMQRELTTQRSSKESATALRVTLSA